MIGHVHQSGSLTKEVQNLFGESAFAIWIAFRKTIAAGGDYPSDFRP